MQNTIEAAMRSLGVVTLDARKHATKRVTSAEVVIDHGYGRIEAVLDDGTRGTVLTFYADELTFTADEVTGLTVDEVHTLFTAKDIAYLRS